MAKQEIRHFHLFCGLGGGAAGFNRGQARVGRSEASFRCLGGVDSDAAAIEDFGRIVGVPGTVMDLFDRQQYLDWHGAEPPADWSEVSPADLRKAAGNERPHIVFTSPPCKGFSGLLAEGKSKTARYQALNALTLRGVWLALEAWKDDPPEFFLFENVPRVMHRGRTLLDRINTLLESYGYAVAETTHDCGELGGLAQHRRRFLLVARHTEKVPPFLYEPERRPMRSVGEVLSKLPLPGSEAAGPMHGLPRLQWRTWVRLAFVKAGTSWQSLERFRYVDGRLADYGLAPVTSGGPVLPVNDPRRAPDRAAFGQYGVIRWSDVGSTVTGQAAPGSGPFSVADPRPGRGAKVAKFNNCYRVVHWRDSSPAVTGGTGPSAGGIAVSDPRVAAGAPILEANASLPGEMDRDVVQITSDDGTWHRPFSTLELAALQSLVDPEEHMHFQLAGRSDGSWRERIGNAVPRDAAEAIAGVMGTTLLLAWTETTMLLPFTPVWVRPLATAIAVDQPLIHHH